MLYRFFYFIFLLPHTLNTSCLDSYTTLCRWSFCAIEILMPMFACNGGVGSQLKNNPISYVICSWHWGIPPTDMTIYDHWSREISEKTRKTVIVYYKSLTFHLLDESLTMFHGSVVAWDRSMFSGPPELCWSRRLGTWPHPGRHQHNQRYPLVN